MVTELEVIALGVAKDVVAGLDVSCIVDIGLEVIKAVVNGFEVNSEVVRSFVVRGPVVNGVIAVERDHKSFNANERSNSKLAKITAYLFHNLRHRIYTSQYK